ncbi:MutS-related protein [Fulvivirga sedimenti]|uniref:DNA mismatch repair proteins mutS family domain-containing protein n=1 Tax=Fulvivirga sedimenti TaxID=2879465 RepID=A0A9X1HUF0_9BACT|nr:hypothetical protein [Fulvivirga sedimenti]MCA6078493.1 hypothetical protein [Fulvivirga sedimenti]
MTHPREYYVARIQDFRLKMDLVSREVYRLSWARVLVFLLFLVLFIFFANDRNGLAMVVSIAVFPLVFGTLVNRFNRKSELRETYRNLMEMSEEELLRLDYQLKTLDDGSEYITREHPYSYDLDLFGKHSLFQLLNRTQTPDGRQMIVSWMLAPASKDEILIRQEAVSELQGKMDWVHQFLSAGRSATATVENTGRLKSWLLDKSESGASHLFTVLSYIMPSLLVAALVAVVFFGVSIYILFPFLAVNGIILARIQEKMRAVSEQTEGNVKLLRSYEKMITCLIREDFTSDRLQQLCKPFGMKSVQAIKSLRNLLDILDGRSNMFYGIFDLAFLLDVHLLNRIRKWKSENEHDLSTWFENIAELEVLSSMGAHAYLFPGHTIPEISADWQLNATGVGHPLINPNECVINDFTMQGEGTVVIVTGSNMSGKSTFLRTVGINMILGLMGSVVCAERMLIPVSQVFTGMRSEDDLASHISSFYAELRRIRALLEKIQTSELPVLFMLDEILKGTNTQDRHRGSEGLVKQLSMMPAFGFISTHDLEIGRLGEQDKKIQNYSFNSSIKGDEIIFDYKISPGICHSFNASKLMEKMGIHLAD